MKKILLLLFTLIALRTSAQDRFTRILYQDTALMSSYDFGYCLPIQTTIDGGHLLQYYLGQWIPDGSGYDYRLLIKTDNEFVPQWQVRAIASLALPDSSIFTVNYADSSDCTLIEKRDMAGNVLSQKLIRRDSSLVWVAGPVYANSKIRLIGRCTISGTPWSTHPIFVDIDNDGALINAFSLLGGDLFTYIENLFADDSGNYYFVVGNVGFTRKVAKVRPDNTVVWCHTFNSGTNYVISSITGLPGGDVLVGGNYMDIASATERIFLMKLSPSGDLIWQKTADRQCRMTDMSVMENGAIAIAAGGIPVTASSLPIEDNILLVDTSAYVKRAVNIAPDRTAWPFYRGLSLPYARGNNDWYYAAVAIHPYAPMVFNTDSLFHGHCTSDAVSFGFFPFSLFLLSADTFNFAPFALMVSSYSQAMPTQSQLYADSCDYTLPVNVKSVDAGGNILLYPNPASNVINVTSPSSIERVEFFDVMGKLAYTVQVNSKQKNIDLSFLGSGYYLARITGDGFSVYQKLVIVH